MRILHVSDTHGVPEVPTLGDFDVIVHSGDLMPNRTYGVRPVEFVWQKEWLEANVHRFPDAWRHVPVLLTPGNHDYADAVPVLREHGIDARRLCNEFLELDGVGFYGLPWTPTFYDWNWMCGREDMRRHLAPAEELLNQGMVDVFVSHGPMYGVLDRNADGERCGCKELRRVIKDARHPPGWLLHGHIHEAAGVQPWGGTTISNAARTQRIVEVFPL